MKLKSEGSSKCTIGLLQMALSKNPDDNLKKAVDWVNKAVKKGARVICLPELFRSQYFCQKEDIENFNLAETIPGPSTDALSKIAKKNEVVIVASLFEKRARGIYHNTIALINTDGEISGLLIEQFIAAWSSGASSGVFEGVKFQADVTKSPVPRFDLLNTDHYLYIGVQFSRGCPFNCEFCDIIELYGRVPRAKTNEQMLAELDALYRIGYRGHVDFVDDNLIGNKKALKRLLPAITEWQKARGFPFEFSTEASMNLADDSQLLQMMRQANFFAIFVGIESPDTETLIATQKKQNTRRSLAASVHKIYEAGMYVIAGFIVGFDTDRGSVSEAMVECIEATSIPVCMVGLLMALANTQLTRRLEKEGRLLPLQPGGGDQCTAGLNFVTLRPRREVLEDFREILAAIYAPEAYFRRVRTMGRALNRPRHPSKVFVRLALREARALGRLVWCVTFQRPDIGRHLWATVFDCARHNFRGLEYVIAMVAFYLHLGVFADFLIHDLDRQIAALPKEPSRTQERLPVSEFA